MSHPQTVFDETTFTGPSLLQSRRAQFNATGTRAQLDQLRQTGRYDCFNLKWQPGVYDDLSRWPCPPPMYWDSDIAKWIEGACYMLLTNSSSTASTGEPETTTQQQQHDPEVDAAVRDIVDMMRKAQGEDGYLNMYYTVIEPQPEKRWSNLRDCHELYNAGHLIEAALAHKKYYKNDDFLEPMLKYVKYMRTIFGPEEGKRHGYPGHPEIELALLRLHAVTGDQDAYELGKYFIEERGNPKGQDGQHYYDWESDKRGDHPWKRPNAYDRAYDHFENQSHKPIVEQLTMEGHAVRGLYLYTGVADLLCLDELGIKEYAKKGEYFDALKRLWNDMVDKKMYMTGGVGAIWKWEGFGIPYFLPQGSDDGGCHNETCASIAVILLAERLLHVDLDSCYADIMELCLYNTVMGGMSLDNTGFTYVNQLASSEKHKDKREPWFETSCCPPNLLRLFGSMGGYLWDYGGSGAKKAFINVHLYTKAKVEFEVEDGGKISLQQTSEWPLDGKVSLHLQAPTDVETTIKLRWPAWSSNYQVTPPAQSEFVCEKGYIILPASYTSEHPEFTIEFDGFTPRHIFPHPYTNQQVVALARGPLVYCVEDTDNPWEEDHFRDVGLDRQAEIKEQAKGMTAVPELKQGEDEEYRYIELQAKGWIRQISQSEGGEGSRKDGRGPFSVWNPHVANMSDATKAVDLVFVPYYLRSNRGGHGMMRVGLLRD